MQIWRFGWLGLALVAGAQQGGVNFYSADKEIAVGGQLARSMAAETTPLNNPMVTAYVDRMVHQLAQELTRQIPDSKLPYNVSIVKEKVGAEPATLMGGYIFISAGTIAAAQSEGEFVGILAHAMAHVANRDASRKATRENLRAMATVPLAQYPGVAASLGGGNMPTQIELLNRNYEVRADALAAETMAVLGYSPADLANYVERNAKDDRLPGWRSFQAKRVASLRDAAAKATVSPRSDGAEFARVREATISDEQRIARLGASGNDNVADVKRLAENPRPSAGLLVAALHTVPDSEEFARADDPSIEHALWLIRALRYLTGGKDFRAKSRHAFGRSEEERNRKYWLSFDRKHDFAFFGYWMSRNRWYIAPVDAQKDIIAQWQQWYAASGEQFEYQPLRNPPPEKWIW